MQKLYSLGEIFRLKLLKNHEGEPYATKSTISQIVSKLKAVEKMTPWGVAKCLTKTQIDAFNQFHKFDK